LRPLKIYCSNNRSTWLRVGAERQTLIARGSNSWSPFQSG